MKTESVRTCPVCENNQFHPFLNCKDYTVSQENFPLIQCGTCAFVLTSPRPEEAAIGRYYHSDSYISHSNTRRGFVAQAYHQVRRLTLRSKLRYLQTLVEKPDHLLDIGCGTGLFLSVCRENGWQVTGVEPDAGARQQASQLIQQPLVSSIWELPPTQRYQLITMWHVLEHVHRLEETLTWLGTHLEPAGRLLIAVPNHLSEDAQTYREYWAAYDVPRHLYHFTPQTLPRLLARFGFSLLETQPMPFDAYYVSMLSTRYRSGTVRYAEALWQGWQSNRSAAKTGNYSSLIYTFEKSRTH